MIPLGIVTGILAVGAALLAWRLVGLNGKRLEALKARDEAKGEADQIRKDSKSSQEELESKRRELSSLQAEYKELKKKLYDSKEEVRRRGGRPRDDADERTTETRIRDLNAALDTARGEILNLRKVKEQAEKSLEENRDLRARVMTLERELAAQKARSPEPGATPRAAESSRAAEGPRASAGAGADVAQLRLKLAERERAIEALKRKADNAGRIYLVTKSQLELAQEKIAGLGLRYAEAMAKLEGRPPPLGAKKRGRPDAPSEAEEAEALAEAMDESEEIVTLPVATAEFVEETAPEAAGPAPEASEEPAAEKAAAEKAAAEKAAAEKAAPKDSPPRPATNAAKDSPPRPATNAAKQAMSATAPSAPASEPTPGGPAAVPPATTKLELAEKPE